MFKHLYSFIYPRGKKPSLIQGNREREDHSDSTERKEKIPFSSTFTHLFILREKKPHQSPIHRETERERDNKTHLFPGPLNKPEASTLSTKSMSLVLLNRNPPQSMGSTENLYFTVYKCIQLHTCHIFYQLK